MYLTANKNKKERVGRILQMHANQRKEIDKVYSGDIAAAVGLKITVTGDTICDEAASSYLRVYGIPRASYRACYRAKD